MPPEDAARDAAIAGDSLTPVFGLAGQSVSGGAVGLLLSNPTNRSVRVDLLVASAIGPTVTADAGSVALCSVVSPCEVRQITDESGKVHIMGLSEGALVLDPWAVAVVGAQT